MYQRIDVHKLYAFFNWVLNQRRGKDGRRRQGLKYRSSLETYWKIFRLVYEREMQEKISRETSRRLNKNVYYHPFLYSLCTYAYPVWRRNRFTMLTRGLVAF